MSINLADLHLNWGAFTSKGKRYVSYSLARSVWTNGSCRKEIVVKLGKLSDEEIVFWRQTLKDAKKRRKTTTQIVANPRDVPIPPLVEFSQLTANSQEPDTRDLQIAAGFLESEDMLIKKKFTYDEHDQSVDIQSYEDAVNHAFADVPDPRVADNLQYPFYGLLLTILAGILAGAKSISGIYEYGKEKAALLCPLLDLRRHPSYTAFWWILTRTNPEILNKAFIKWIKLVADTLENTEKKISIDGKTLRGAKKVLFIT